MDFTDEVQHPRKSRSDFLDDDGSSASWPEAVRKSRREFLNDDGSSASWLEAVPIEARERRFLLWFAVGLGATLLVWGVQYLNGAFDFANRWFGLSFLALGIVIGVARFGQAEERRYSTRSVEYTLVERLRRAAPSLGIGLACLVALLGVQVAAGQFRKHWWYVSPILPILLYGVWRLFERSSQVPTPAASEAKVFFEALEARPIAAEDW